jgi:hypothetical protein
MDSENYYSIWWCTSLQVLMPVCNHVSASPGRNLLQGGAQYSFEEWQHLLTVNNGQDSYRLTETIMFSYNIFIS